MFGIFKKLKEIENKLATKDPEMEELNKESNELNKTIKENQNKLAAKAQERKDLIKENIELKKEYAINEEVINMLHSGEYANIFKGSSEQSLEESLHELEKIATLNIENKMNSSDITNQDNEEDMWDDTSSYLSQTDQLDLSDFPSDNDNQETSVDKAAATKVEYKSVANA